MKNKDKIQGEGKSQNGVFMSFVTGSFLSNEVIIKNLPYIFFLTFLGILYIANGYYSEKTVKQLYRINNEIKELRSEYISNKSDLELLKQQSQVAFSIKSLELKESLTPPSKIIIQKQDQ